LGVTANSSDISCNGTANGTATVQCVSAAIAPTTPNVTDICGNAITPILVSTVDNPTPLTCEGTITYNYSYTDCAGLVTPWSYTYTIENSDFIMPADQASTIACAAQLVAPSVPTVTDNCGNILTPTGPVVSATPACEGNVTYTYTFTDCEGNTHDWVYTYTIETEDFTMPADQGATVECAAQITTPTLPVVVDNCGNVLTPSTPVITATPACEGTKIYTYTYTDCEGNTHDWTYTYTVDRITPPTVPANGSATVQCASDAIAPLGNSTINLIANGDFEAGLTGWTASPGWLLVPAFSGNPT
jgi:hypothetical protein